MPGPEEQRKIILVVDDEPAICQLVKRMLEAEGYDAEGVLSGAAALERLATPPVPDLVLTDIMMPKMNGYALVRAIKANVATGHLPVGIISATRDPLAERRALASGAFGLIEKPIDVEALRALVETALRSPDAERS